MPEVVADTSALSAFFIRTEKHHNVARRYVEAHPNTRWVILESVFDETVTWFRARVSPQDSIVIGRVLRDEHRYRNLSDDDDAATWEAFCRYADKAWATPTARSSSWHSASASPKYLPSTSTSAR